MDVPNKTELLQIRLQPADKRMIRAAAKASRLKTAEWARMILLDAANGKGKANG